MQLAGYPLGWEVRTLSDRALRSSGVEPRYAFEVNDTRTLLDLVEIGLGVAVFPEAIAAPRGARLREIAISGRRWDWTVRAEAVALKYRDSGCAKYSPLTLDPGHIAYDSVSSMPVFASTSSSRQIVPFSV